MIVGWVTKLLEGGCVVGGGGGLVVVGGGGGLVVGGGGGGEGKEGRVVVVTGGEGRGGVGLGVEDENKPVKSILLVIILVYSSKALTAVDWKSVTALFTDWTPNLDLYTAKAPETWGAAIEVPEAAP